MSAASRARSRTALLATAAAVAALTLSACSSGGTSGGGGDTGFVPGDNGIDTVAQDKRAAAPVLSGETIDGKQLSTAGTKGKVLVINVWGSWCPPCRAEAKNFQTVYDDVKGQGVEFVGINTRDTNTTVAKAFEKEFGITYPSLYDPTGKQMLRFKKGTLNPQAIPSTLVIDRKGRLAARALTPLSEETLRSMLKPVLAEK
ncbi:redoxin domain-containing protein [Streptomyces viridochromogenes]|uniref:Redoxin domain-containing protein n=1 Tax=Streptomyces viridochromogenes TaxID=1938 RepID=A0A0J7ZB38_STRVR|nr:TlpA disulfide reductase family protein [Streptomyces viridochromogenes]KMS72657.1 redoxin domain-containing protein [Streptomyces viridochromogenes]KOG09196.1 redoxin domain-containing protein [Streptomyces viridochromogenes]KOG25248.1 redoxin domain-containing protein [Streptomyces viridochromogenes]